MKSLQFLWLGAMLFVLSVLPVNATILFVKPDASSTAWSSQTTVYTDFTAAITAAVSGDEIWVAAGTYKPTTGTDRSISFNLKEGVTVLGGFVGTESVSTSRNWVVNKTILSGDIGVVGSKTDNSYHVVSVVGTSTVPITRATVLDGFVVENGNSNSYGGGIYCSYASPVIKNCLIQNNSASYYGGGVYGFSSSPFVFNCILTLNYAADDGGALCSDSYSNFKLTNLTVVNNKAGSQTGGLDSWGGSLKGSNLIVWGNTPSGNDGDYTYSCIEGESGTGIINNNPLFIDASNSDFRLNVVSPCIDKGKNDSVPTNANLDFALNARIQNSIVDMGAIEGGVETPVLVAPANNTGIKGVDGGNTVELSWKWNASVPANLAGYKLQYWTGKNDTVKQDVSGLSAALLFPIGQHYYWRIGAALTDGSVLWSIASRFDISHLGTLYVKQGLAGDGSSWSSAFGKLQDALATACYGDEIWVAAGTYKPANGTNRDSVFSISNGVKVYGGFVGTETKLTERNWKNNKTILSGDIGVQGVATDNSNHVVFFVGTASSLIDSTTLLDGFIVEKGNSTSSNYADTWGSNSGGGISCAYASPVIQNCLVRSNYASYWGGGLYSFSGKPTVINTVFYRNGSQWGGGAIISYTNATVKLINVTVAKNSCANNLMGGIGSWGGAINGVNVISFGNSPTYSDGSYSYSCREEGSGTGVINKDPLFVDINNGDFRLRVLSPCINRGQNSSIPSGVTLDFALKNRIQVDTVDMGALEGGVNCPVLIAPVDNYVVKGLVGGNTLSFSWGWSSGTAPTDFLGYKFQYWTSKGDTIMVNTKQSSIEVTFAEKTLLYWRVGAVNSSDLIDWSCVRVASVTHVTPLYVKQGANGDGSSWSSAFGKLQDALKEAIKGDEVWVAAGTYKPANGTNRDSTFSIGNGIKVYGGFAGTETVLSARNWNKNKTILSGDVGVVGTETDNSYHVVSFVGTSTQPIDTTTVLDGLVIEKGYAINYGGGIYERYASPYIKNCVIRDNYASNYGGGVYCYGGAPIIINSVIEKNSASYGGGLCADSYSTFKLINATIANNSATIENGGLYSWGGSISGYNVIVWKNVPIGVDGSFSTSSVEGVSSIKKDPMFIDAEASDYRLNALSLCINKGTNASFPSDIVYDLNLNARIQKDTIDMGAFEGGVVTPILISPKNNAIVKGVEGGFVTTFSWNWTSAVAPSNIAGYKLQYWTSNHDTTMVDVAGLSKELTLNANTQYYWRVAAVENTNALLWSPIQSYVINHATSLFVKQGGSGNGSSWASAFGKLQDALKVALPGDEIWVAAGTYKPANGTNRDSTFSIGNGIKVYGGFEGTEIALSARNWNKNKTILSGDVGIVGTATDNSYHVVSFVGTSTQPIDSTTVLDGLVIEKGYSTNYGGGIYERYASPYIKNCVIRDNYASNYGGGVYGYGGSIILKNCILTKNRSSNRGGALCADDYSTFKLLNTVVVYNTSVNSVGGIYSWGGAINGVNSILWGNTPSGNSGSYTYSCVESGSGTGVTTKDPLFVNVDAGDFRLNILSPCINKGNNTVLLSSDNLDFALSARIQEDTVDMGAFEGGVEAPVLISPKSNVIVKGVEGGVATTFSWGWTSSVAPSYIMGYKLQYWTSNLDTTTVDAAELSKELILNAGIQYYWRVAAIDNSNTLLWSPIQRYVINHATSVFVKQGGSGNGSSWSSAFGKLQDALKVALPGDEVWIAAGTYKPANGTNRDSTFSIPNGIMVYGGFEGTETVLSARNWNKNKTILSGDVGVVGTATDNSYHVVSLLGTSTLPIDTTTVLDGLVIEKGYAINYGGGVYERYASPYIKNCLIRDNYASSYGGGVYGYGGVPTLKNCIFTKNRSSDGGGALCADSYSTFKLLNTVVVYNKSVNSAGGIYSWGGAINSVNSIIWNNTPSGNDGSYTYSCVESGSGTGVTVKDPLFVNADAGDFRLNILSPCINRGNNKVLLSSDNLDFALSARIQKDTVDMGAFEGGVEAPILTSPKNNAIVKGVEGGVATTFSWGWSSSVAPSNITGYKLQYWTSNNDTTTVDVTELSKALTLNAGTQYYWRVAAVENTNALLWSPIQSYVINHATSLFVKQGGLGNGSSWTSAFGKLQDALKTALPGDEIWVATGTYKPANGTNRDSTFSIGNGIKVYGGFEGTETVLSARNWNKNKTILSGDVGVVGTATDNSYHVVSLVGTSTQPIDTTTVLDGLVVEKGYSSNYGGGIYERYASPYIKNCVIRDNYASDYGGGVYGYGGAPTIINSVIEKNSAGYGGGLCADSYSKFKLINATIANNSATIENGGLYSWGGSISGYNVIVWKNLPIGVNGSFSASSVEGVSSIKKDPMFIDAEASDYRLNALSLCINKGINASLPSDIIYDITLNARIQKDTIDIGAFEGGVEVPILIFPKNNAIVKGVEGGVATTFSWGWTSSVAPSNITGYKLQYWTSNFDTTTVDVAGLAKELTLNANTQYYWRVAAVENTNTLLWSPVYSYVINHTTSLFVKQGGLGNGSSWTSAFGKLQDALKTALPGDEIWVAAGTYKPTNGTNRDSTFSISNGIKVYGGFEGTEIALSARNWYKNKTILSGDVGVVGTETDNSYHVVSLVGTSTQPIDTTTVLDGLVVEKGYSSNNGGGIYERYASPYIKNCVIKDNYANVYGGGVYGYGGTTILKNCILTKNRSSDSGGALCADDYSTFKLLNTVVVYNTSVNNVGGIYSWGGAINGVNSILWGNIPSGNSGSYTSCVESGSGVTTKDPLFVDANAGDFRLKILSPCINKGNNTVLLSSDTLDFALSTRVQKDTVDIGAFEGGVLCPEQVSPINIARLKGDDVYSSRDVKFSWKWPAETKSADFTGYVLQYWTKGGDTISIKDLSATDTTLSLHNANRYYWRVGALSSVQTTVDWSSVYNFTISNGRPIYVKKKETTGAYNWQYAYSDLQRALAVALPGDEIWVAAGTYTPTAGTNRDSTFSIPNGVKVLGGFSGFESYSYSRNWNKNKTILSGNIANAASSSDNSKHVVSFIGSSSALIDTSTFLDGFIVEKAYNNNYGGGIYCVNASPVVKNCVVRFNYTSYYGGGFYVTSGYPQIRNSVFIRNKAIGGAAFYSDYKSLITISNSTICKNISSNYSALMSWGGNFSVKNSIVWYNSTSSNSGSYTYSCVENGNYGVGNIAIEPMFVDTAANNFRLLPQSLCINKGSNEFTTASDSLDIDQLQRVSGLVVDMGAYESAYPKLVKPVDEGAASIQANWLTYRWTTDYKYEGASNDPFSSPSVATKFHIKVWEKGDTAKSIENSFVNRYSQISTTFNYATTYQWQVGTVVGDYTYWSDTSVFYVGHDHPLYVKTGGTGDGSSWDNAFGSVSDALTNAIKGDEIWVAAGTYKPTTGTDRSASFKLKSNVALYGGFVGTERYNMAEPAKNITILSGDIGVVGDDTDNSYHVFDNQYTTTDSLAGALINGFTISGGNAGTKNGGAMINAHASVRVSNCIFSNNKAQNGGAISNESNSVTNIYNSLFYRNAAVASGGAVFNDATSKSLILSSTISGNTAANGAGLSGNGNVGNTIVYGNGTNEIEGDPTVTYSCVKGGYVGTGNVSGAPGFKDASADDYRITSFSSCYNKGSDALLPTDKFMDLWQHEYRSFLGSTDIGAYELTYFERDFIKVDSVTPAHNTVFNQRTGPIVIYFNQPIKVIDVNKIIVTPSVAIYSQSVSNDGKSLTLSFEKPWKFDQHYSFVVGDSSVSYADNELIGIIDTTFAFTFRSCIPAKLTLAKVDASYCPNVATALSIAGVTGDANTGYKWYHNNNLIESMNGQSLITIDSIQPQTLGAYRCVVDDLCGTATSDSVTLKMKDNVNYPVIVQKWNDVLLVNDLKGYFDHFTWKFNNVAQDDIFDKQYITANLSNGTVYSVSVLDTVSGCIVSSSFTSAKTKAKQIQVYPNPVRVYQDVYIDFGNAQSGMIRLFDMKGILVYKTEFSTDSQYVLKNTNFTPGVYLLEIESNGERTQTKLIIER